jgi:hypothetical protein
VQVSASAFGPFLAAGYDALKAVDPTIRVVGVGLSPRGNDRPFAKSNVSTSPVRFLASLGAWYRSSGRLLPLMDGFSFHPYPNRATDPLDRGYAWPNAGFVNLDRIKQALWDAFVGTPQPTTLDGLRLYLDEVGWQVDTTGLDGYDGDENVDVTDELTQAGVYAELLGRAACDPDIAQVNVFGFRDDSARSGFQAGLYRADRSARPSADAVRGAIADATSCSSTSVTAWRPATGVLGAKKPVVRPGVVGLDVELAVAEDAFARVCLLAGTHTVTSARRELASRLSTADDCVEGAVAANRTSVLALDRIAGPQTVAVQLAAAANSERSTTLVRRLR